MNGLHQQLVRFLFVGLLNTLIGLAAIYGLMFFLHANLVISNGIGYAIGLAVSFLLNKTWTFNDHRNPKEVLPAYLTLAAVAYGINLLVVVTAHSIIKVNPYFAQFAGIGFYTVTMFVGSRWLVFRKINKMNSYSNTK